MELLWWWLSRTSRTRCCWLRTSEDGAMSCILEGHEPTALNQLCHRAHHLASLVHPRTGDCLGHSNRRDLLRCCTGAQLQFGVSQATNKGTRTTVRTSTSTALAISQATRRTYQNVGQGHSSWRLTVGIKRIDYGQNAISKRVNRAGACAATTAAANGRHRHAAERLRVAVWRLPCGLVRWALWIALLVFVSIHTHTCLHAHTTVLYDACCACGVAGPVWPCCSCVVGVW
jgi:hypothetical protein